MTTARVLVVDDDVRVLNLVKLTLTLDGYEVLATDRPHQALEIVRGGPAVHLVLSDVEMPAMPGTHLIREIARLSPGTVRVLMTGGIIDSAQVPDGVPVLRKPFSIHDLISAVRTSLAQSP